MSAPWNQQQELADLLTAADLKTHPEVPDRATPPFRYVLAADPWLEVDPAGFGRFKAGFRVICVTGKGTNTEKAKELSDMTRAVIRALKGTKFSLDPVAVGGPQDFATGSGVSLGAPVNVVTTISRAEYEQE